jgi:hypothetical protein
METVLGLIGMVVFIVATIAFAAGVTYAIVRISPTRRAKEKTPAPKAS